VARKSECGFKISRQGTLDRELRPCPRVSEPQQIRMEELAIEVEIGSDAVDWIARDWQPDCLEMHTDLVGAPGLETDIEQRMGAEHLAELEPCDGLASRGRVERSAHAVDPISSDWRVDLSCPRSRKSARKRKIPTLYLPAPDHAREPLMSLRTTGNDDESGCVPVEPVDDAGPLIGPTCDSALEQRVNECRRGVRPSTGMNHESSRLVDDQEVGILVENRDLDRRWDEPWGRIRDLDSHQLPFFEAIALWSPEAVDEHGARGDQGLGSGTRPDGTVLCYGTVEPLPGPGISDAEVD
jgi:hypothetical protein